jgi:hypothetical protein
MGKRKAFDQTTTEELAKDLKASTGAGMDAFFPSQISTKSPTPLVEEPKAEIEGKPNEVVIISKLTDRTVDRPTDRPTGRTKERHSFDVYKDQLDALEDMQYKAGKKGRKPPLGQLVREALDGYIAKANKRTGED